MTISEIGNVYDLTMLLMNTGRLCLLNEVVKIIVWLLVMMNVVMNYGITTPDYNPNFGTGDDIDYEEEWVGC